MTYSEQVAANFASVCQSFDEFRRDQVEHIHGRVYGPMDELVTSALFRAVNMAVADCENYNAGKPWSEIPLRAIPLDTGTGKTQSALAYIAHGCRLDPSFSAVYVAGTIQALVDAMRDLQKLGVSPAVSFSNRDREHDAHVAEAGVNYIKNKGELTQHRVILVTHKFFSPHNKDVVGRYRSQRRSLFVIDECPELVEVYKCNPLSVQELLTTLVSQKARPEWCSVLTDVVDRMNRAAAATGPTFTPERIIAPEEAAILGDPTRDELEVYIADSVGGDDRIRAVNRMRGVFSFLTHASNDACFYSRRESVFFSYRMRFEAGPGHVLLDATADVHSLVTMMPGVGPTIEVPRISYEHLTLLHVEHPKNYRARHITKTAAGAKPYAEWIRAAVVANSTPGDDVLVVTHKNIVEHRYLPATGEWEGRKVDCVWWGGPHAGTNRYRHKTHVFCFAEAHRPRAIDVADVHGVSMLPLSMMTLKDAESTRRAGDAEYAPTGIYLKPWEGRLLAMTKQAAMRGKARNVDEYGQAAPMVLLTTMPIRRLHDNLTSLFPGAARIRPGVVPDGSGPVEAAGRGRVQALRLELGTTVQDRLGADEIEARLGIPSDQLRKVFTKAAMSGWILVSSADLGLPGRQKWLVRAVL